METVPFSQSFKDDRMTTWRFLRYSMPFSEHFNGGKCCLERAIIVFYTLPKSLFGVKFVFISCMSREETPTVEFLAAHA